MGGASLLLAVAATTTIGYGWQPDKQGGLEYIVQIPPGELERSGEITSRIDPRVRGMVSRVVIRVGDGPVPQDFGDLAPNILALAPTGAQGKIQQVQVLETQSSQPNSTIAVDEPPSIVRGQSGLSNSNGFRMPMDTANSTQRTSQYDTNVSANGASPMRNPGSAQPSTNYNANASAAPRIPASSYANTQSSQTYRNGDPAGNNPAYNESGQFVGPRRDGAVNNTGNFPSTGSYSNAGSYPSAGNYSNTNTYSNNTSYPNTGGYSNNGGYSNQGDTGGTGGTMASNQSNDRSSYRDSSWIAGSSQPRPRPSTSYDPDRSREPQTYASGTNQNSNSNYDNNAYSDNNGGYRSSTFANPNYGLGNDPRSQYSNNSSRDQSGHNDPRGDFNNNRQPSSYAQGSGSYDNRDSNQYQGNGPIREGYVPGNQSSPYSNFGNQYAQGNQNGYGNIPYGTANGMPSAAMGAMNPYGLATNPAALGLASLYGQSDPRFLLAAGGGYFNPRQDSSREREKSESEDKASSILIAERERLSTQTIELRRENESLARVKESLIDDNKTLISENIQAKDRLQSMSVFQFFLMISFLANLYLVVHLSKLYQRYRDLVTTVRSAASTQTA